MGCSTGQMEQCGCDRTVKGTSSEGFEWSGCSHNVAYGNAFSEMFVDARERTKGKGAYRALMNLHNNKAGRKVTDLLITSPPASSTRGLHLDIVRVTSEEGGSGMAF